MRIQCAWCRKWMGEKAPLESSDVSHTICPACSEKLAKGEPVKNPRKPTEAAFMEMKGWRLVVGSQRSPKVFARKTASGEQSIQREARAWRLLQSDLGRTTGLVSVGEYPLLSDASIVADKILREPSEMKDNPLAVFTAAGNPGESTGILSAEDPIYTKREKLRKYNVAVSPLSAHGSDGVRMLIRRLPNFTKADHREHAAAHVQHATVAYNEFQQRLDRELAALEREGVDPGPLISGIVSDRFSNDTKDYLRTRARAKTAHQTIAWLHDQAADSRIVKRNPISHKTALRYAQKLVTHERAGLKENPPKSVSADVCGVVYNRCLEVRAEKTGWNKGLYRHPFSRKANVQILALDNGDLLIHSASGTPLWREA